MITHVQGSIPGRPGIGPIAVLEGDTHLSEWIAQDHRLNADRQGLAEMVVAHIQPGTVVIDAGASLGDHTALYAQRAKMVHAFEPQDESFACLIQNCAHLPNVNAHHAALTDRRGEALIERRTNAGASQIGKVGLPVQTVTLDELALFPSLIKWDVEGSEVRALRGARQTIMRCRPLMVMEVNKWALEPAGFCIRDLWLELRFLGYHRAKDIRTGAPFDFNDGRPEYDIICEP